MALDATARHQCTVYDGPPSRTLHAVVSVLRRQLGAGMRCMYFNTPAMVAGLRSYLSAAGTEVERVLAQGSLVLASDDSHLVAGRFDIDRMIDTLATSLRQALDDGYSGLFAVGDMTWELGAEKDFTKLLEYEWRLEQLFRDQPALSGICQYHRDLMPADAIRSGVRSHASVFISDTLSKVNPHYVPAASVAERAAVETPILDEALVALLAPP